MKNLYSVFDKKAGVYGVPFGHSSDGVAMRDFDSAINHGDGVLSRFASDFDLYRVGVFDEDVGTVLDSVPVFLVNGGVYKSE